MNDKKKTTHRERKRARAKYIETETKIRCRMPRAKLIKLIRIPSKAFQVFRFFFFWFIYVLMRVRTRAQTSNSYEKLIEVSQDEKRDGAELFESSVFFFFCGWKRDKT